MALLRFFLNYFCWYSKAATFAKISAMEGLKSPVYSKNTIEFVTVANEFCKFIDNSESISVTEFVDKSHRLLPLVYLKGTLLPKIEEPYEEFNEKYVTEYDYRFIEEILQSKFGKHDLFEEIFDPVASGKR